MAAENRRVPASLTHRIARITIALGIGLALSLYAYQRVTDPEPAMQRAQEEAVVLAARDILRHYVRPAAELRIVDPVSPDRKVGKSYIYPTETGWEVSGHYRRDDTDHWHPFLMDLNPDASLAKLSVRDSPDSFPAEARQDPKFNAQPWAPSG
jgi:hypothetical protein